MILVILKTIILFPYLVYKAIKDRRNRGIHLYGIYGYFGLPGKGKTIAMSKQLNDYRENLRHYNNN